MTSTGIVGAGVGIDGATGVVTGGAAGGVWVTGK